MAKFSYRNSVHATTKHTPFEANYGYHPADPSTPDTPVSAVPAASAHLKNLHTIHHDPVTNIKNAQATHAKFYNKRVKEISGQEGGPSSRLETWFSSTAKISRHSVQHSSSTTVCLVHTRSLRQRHLHWPSSSTSHRRWTSIQSFTSVS